MRFAGRPADCARFRDLSLASDQSDGFDSSVAGMIVCVEVVDGGCGGGRWVWRMVAGPAAAEK